MKYFTPDLFVKLQEGSTPDAIVEASDAWERAVTDYQACLDGITSQLPEGPARLVQLGSLHDAAVAAMWHTETSFTIVLRPEQSAGQFLVLNYSLIEPPFLDTQALPSRYCSRQPAWLYDELDVEVPETSATGQAKASVFTHAILLSNGWEIRLRFTQLNITQPTSLLPDGSASGELSGQSLQRSA